MASIPPLLGYSPLYKGKQFSAIKRWGLSHHEQNDIVHSVSVADLRTTSVSLTLQKVPKSESPDPGFLSLSLEERERDLKSELPCRVAQAVTAQRWA